MPDAGNETFYSRYLDTLNDRRLGELGAFVHDRLTYNGKPMTLGDYQGLIAGDIAAIPDLRFDVGLLVVNEHQIACRLNFRCTPEREFLGLKPNGRTVSFSEHVFYTLRAGRISEVWSLIDRTAIEAQLAE